MLFGTNSKVCEGVCNIEWWSDSNLVLFTQYMRRSVSKAYNYMYLLRVG